MQAPFDEIDTTTLSFIATTDQTIFTSKQEARTAILRLRNHLKTQTEFALGDIQHTPSSFYFRWKFIPSSSVHYTRAIFEQVPNTNQHTHFINP